MTQVPDENGSSLEALPEPSFDELYRLYCESLEYDKYRWLSRFAESPEHEKNADREYKPQSEEWFREYLAGCTARGSRVWAVNALVLGPEYCDSHPDDPRIQKPPAEETYEKAEDEKAWAKKITEELLQWSVGGQDLS